MAALLWWVTTVVLGLTCATKFDPTETYDILYDKAIEAYLDEDWDKCITFMNEAIEDYHFYVEAQINCRLNCQKIAQNADPQPIASPNMGDMAFWEKTVKQTLCLLKCKKGLLKNRAEIVSKDIARSFEYFRPYDYLQLCYFKVMPAQYVHQIFYFINMILLQKNDLVRAASSAYTFLTMNPNHEVMQANLRHYINELKVDPDHTVNLEAKPFVEFYVRGSDAYGKKDFERTANYFELSLTEYLQSEIECRAMCEGPFDQGWFPDFISSVASKSIKGKLLFMSLMHLVFQITTHSLCAASKTALLSWGISMEKFTKT